MFSLIDTAMLFISVALLGASSVTAWLALRRAGERRRSSHAATVAAAAAQLQDLRDSGLLVMSDEDFQLALELEKHHPGQLKQVARTTYRIIDEAELEPGSFIRLTMKVEYEDEPEDAAKATSRKGHLELITEFT